MTADPRRAAATFALSGADSAVTEQGEAEAVIGNDALSVGPVTVSFLDADALRAGDYRIELDLWPAGRLVLTQLGRRFDAFTAELRRTRNQGRVAGLLAHGTTMPEVFGAAVLGKNAPRPAELQVYDTHVTVVPEDGDPWQVPLGAVTALRSQDDPPAVVFETDTTSTIVGQLARRRDACHTLILRRLEEQRLLLEGLTGQPGFSDGRGVPRAAIEGFDDLLARSTAPERAPCAKDLVAAATGEPRLGFVRLLDPDPQGMQAPTALPEGWAAFLLAPVRGLTALEILAGPSAATYVFKEGIEAVNHDLQMLHFRRAPLALTPEQAEVTPANPHRLALRRLEPLQRLRACTAARLIHNERWTESLRTALVTRA